MSVSSIFVRYLDHNLLLVLKSMTSKKGRGALGQTSASLQVPPVAKSSESVEIATASF